MKSKEGKNIFFLAFVLGKFRIALPITFSALTAYLAFYPHFDISLVYMVSGVFLLASAAMAINQIQERKTDALMERTKSRPLPSGDLNLSEATIIAILFLVSRSVILYLPQGISPLMAGWLTLAWYNLVYTPLKTRTSFAALPGSVVGALPPVIGWLSAGGSLSDHTIWLIMAFFFIGQVPHFWLLLLMHGEDYRQAGLPELSEYFTEKQVRRLIFMWIFWSVIMALFLSLFGIITHTVITILLGFLGLVMVGVTSRLLKTSQKPANFRLIFIQFNIFYLFVMILLIVDSFLTHYL